MNRRKHLKTLAGLAAAALTGSALSARGQSLPATADSSELIYLTPIQSDGRESRCQAEVWFVHDAGSLYVITAVDAWRARAVQRGLSQARIWVGDVGVWSDVARYKALPMVAGRASKITEASIHSAVLEQFGRKYPREWSTWGPRFKSGLADGSRVLLKYQIG